MSALASCRVAMISGSKTCIFLACRKCRILSVMQRMTTLGKTVQSLSSSLLVHFTVGTPFLKVLQARMDGARSYLIQ